MGYTTAEEAWTNLRTHYTTYKGVTYVSLVKEFFDLKYQPGEDVQKYLHNWEAALMKLHDANLRFDELTKVILLLHSLPDQFETLVIALESRDVAGLTLPYAKSRILDEYRWQRKKNPEGEQLIMSRQERKKIKCFKCGELGHVQCRCLKKYDDAEEQQHRVNFATAATDEDDRPILLLASTARCVRLVS